MLHVPIGANSFGAFTPYSSIRPTAAMGVSVTPGTTGYGLWTQIFSALAFDAYGIFICINSGSSNNTSRRGVFNIGIDLAGGTSYTIAISDLLSQSPTYIAESSGQWYYFPLFIPTGATIAAQGWSISGTAQRVMAWVMQKPPNPSVIRKGSFVETFGVTAPEATAQTQGTTTKSSWLQIGTTTNKLWWWQVAAEGTSSDTSFSAATIHVDVAVGDGTNFDSIIVDFPIRVGSGTESYSSLPVTVGCEFPVPAGSGIYIRSWTSGTSPETGGTAFAVYGLGG